MSERVRTYRGSIPAIIVVPHGYDDPNTPAIAEGIIETIDAYAVINKGWERADVHNYYEDKANCNNLNHIQEDVVKQEFLEPILNYANNILDKLNRTPFMFIIHGVSNSVRQKAAEDLDIIIGYGEGKPPSYTCPIDYKDLFLNLLHRAGLNPYQGKAGGKYSGRRKTNLNQLFRRVNQAASGYKFPGSNSMQIEIVRELRENEEIAKLTGELLGEAIKSLLESISSGRALEPLEKVFPSI